MFYVYVYIVCVCIILDVICRLGLNQKKRKVISSIDMRTSQNSCQDSCPQKFKRKTLQVNNLGIGGQPRATGYNFSLHEIFDQ